MAAEQEAQAASQAEASQAESTQAASVLDGIFAVTKQNEREKTKGLVENLIAQIASQTVSVDKDVSRTIRSGVAALDAAISKQLAAVMHTKEFQQLEGTWRGLHYLVMNTETSTQLKIRVLNCTKKDLKTDLERAIEFDQSATFKKLYEDEFGMPGGEPYGALIGDYQFTNHPDDVETLSKMSGIAAASFCPFISSPGPELFGMESWTEMMKPRDMAKIFDTPEYIKWRAFRDSEDSRFAVLAMPRTLARLPYGANTKPIDEFAFEEVALGKGGSAIEVTHDQYCWMNAAYVLGAKLTDSFTNTGFCTRIRGVENGGKVEGLPVHVVRTADGDLDTKCPTEIGITDRREAELSGLGFLPLCHNKNTDFSVFYGGQTTQKPKKYTDPDATSNASISARLPYIMAVSRFSHFLKVIARDKIGSFMERSDCEKWLNNWIHDFVCSAKEPSAEEKARMPLADAKVQVVEVPGSPGEYNAVCFMRPWLQLEKLTASMRLVAKIPKLAGS